jgi:hypothetical protein
MRSCLPPLHENIIPFWGVPWITCIVIVVIIITILITSYSFLVAGIMRKHEPFFFSTIV